MEKNLQKICAFKLWFFIKKNVYNINSLGWHTTVCNIGVERFLALQIQVVECSWQWGANCLLKQTPKSKVGEKGWKGGNWLIKVVAKNEMSEWRWQRGDRLVELASPNNIILCAKFEVSEFMWKEIYRLVEISSKF